MSTIEVEIDNTVIEIEVSNSGIPGATGATGPQGPQGDPGVVDVLNDIDDVTITSVADNEVLAYDSGTSEWINQTAAEAGLATSGHNHDATYQPLDSDLTAIAALTTTSFGRSLLQAANAAALRTLADSPSNAEAVLDAIIDAKGDLIVGSAADTPARLAVGTNGQILVADSAEATGIKWAAASGGGDLLAANNLSDVAVAATAFSNIKQAATETATGVVELATTTEATTGTDTARAVTAAGVKAVVDAHVAAADPHTGYVLESLFDANTILAANSDNTPAALTVAEQTLVGRITAGNIDDLSPSAVLTLLGLSTSDSPQFTAVNLGHASDTTLARSGAGDVTIEGNAVYRAGGTDVPVTDGGTGSSTASGARTNLGLVIGTDVQAYKADALKRAIQFHFDGGGSEIADNTTAYAYIPADYTITKVEMVADVSGSIIVDLWVDTYANWPATSADKITASAPPTISSATKSTDSTLTGWTLGLTEGYWLIANVTSCTTITKCTVALPVTLT